MRPRPAAANDRRIGRFAFLAGLAPLREHPGRAAGMAAARRPPLAATHRVAHRVHGGPAVVRLAAHPALATRLAQAAVHVIGLADRADGRPTFGATPTD